MDATNCSRDGLLATDEWIIKHPYSTCEVPVPALVTVLCFIVVVKIAVQFDVWRFWLKRQANMRKGKVRLKFIHRQPIVPVLSSAVTAVYVLTLVLVPTNVISANNGWGTVLYALSVFFWGIICLFHVKKYVMLGRKLIPLALIRGPLPINSSSSNEDSSSRDPPPYEWSHSAEKMLSLLNTFDFVLQFLIALMGMCLVLMIFIAFIPGLIFPANELWARLVFALTGVSALLLEVTLLYHLERLIRATKICSQSIGEKNGGNLGPLREALRIMRTSQIVWFLLGNITTSIHLLAATGVIDISWIFILVNITVETIGSAFAFFVTRRPGKKRRAKTDVNSAKNEVAMVAPKAVVVIDDRSNPTVPTAKD
jgi:hypothetical protein